MTKIIDVNEFWDQDGNLVSREEVERIVPDETPMTAFVNTLTEEQRLALLAALQA